MIYFSLSLPDLEKVSRSNPETLDLVPTLHTSFSSSSPLYVLQFLKRFKRFEEMIQISQQNHLRARYHSRGDRLDWDFEWTFRRDRTHVWLWATSEDHHYHIFQQ